METLNYIGCKKTLLPYITDIYKKEIPDLKHHSFADLFAGTGTVSWNAIPLYNDIISNDIEYYSYIINYALLKSSYSETLQKTIDFMNTLDRKEGLIFLSFSPNDKSERMFFTPDNAKRCDAMRIYLETIKQSLSKKDYMFLLASIIVSVDKVANTSCVYGAYLKRFKKTALEKFFVKPIHKNQQQKHNKVFNRDVIELINLRDFDVVYLDPPYNQRQYGANYSPLNYIALYDENIKLCGKTALISDYTKSSFCSKTKVVDTFISLIKNIKCNILFISYNNEGLMDFSTFKNLLLEKGDVVLYKIPYRRFKSKKDDGQNDVMEYVWVIKNIGSGKHIFKEESVLI